MYQPSRTTQSSLLSLEVTSGSPVPGRVVKQLSESLTPFSPLARQLPCVPMGLGMAQKGSGSSVLTWCEYGKSCGQALCIAAKFISRLFCFTITYSAMSVAGVLVFA